MAKTAGNGPEEFGGHENGALYHAYQVRPPLLCGAAEPPLLPLFPRAGPATLRIRGQQQWCSGTGNLYIQTRPCGQHVCAACLRPRTAGAWHVRGRSGALACVDPTERRQSPRHPMCDFERPAPPQSTLRRCNAVDFDDLLLMGRRLMTEEGFERWVVRVCAYENSVRASVSVLCVCV
jgi:hypothetical protein